MIGQHYSETQRLELIGGENVKSVSPEVANGNYPKPAYDPLKPIYDFEADGTTQYVRVFNDGSVSSMKGAWMMKADDIKGLTPEQIKAKFDLPQLPTKIADVDPPKGTQIRTGTVNSSNFGDQGGGIQFQILEKTDLNWFSNPRDL